MASTAICILETDSDVEVADALGVRLDELLPRLDVRSHQLLERVVDGGDVLDLDLQQHAGLRVHRRLPQLFGVHLAKTLHARGLGILAELSDGLVAIAFRVAPDDLLALEDLEERRLRHVEIALLDDLRKVSEEKREQKSADVAAVYVRVGHRDDAVV